MLERFPNQRFNIDLKDNNPRQVKHWSELIKKHDAIHRVLTASQYTKNLVEVRKIFPGMAISFTAGEVFKFYIKNKFRGFEKLKKKKFGGVALQILIKMSGMRTVSERSLKNAHELGFKMHVWTINHEKTMISLLDIGIDAIFTDDPVLLKRVLSEYFK